jgi:DNA repair exonuclease SbcCD ATPase subunit
VVTEDVNRLEASAERSLELADRLREKVMDLEENLRTVMQDASDAAAVKLRAEQAETYLEEAREGSKEAHERAGEAESRLADLEQRLASLDERIAGLSDTAVVPDVSEDVVDLREAEQAVEGASEEPTEEPLPPKEPPASRWSAWRAT